MQTSHMRRAGERGRAAEPNGRCVISVTDRYASRIYGQQHRTREIPILTTTFRQTREMIGEWRRRARSRRELAMLCGGDRQDLACRFDLNAEILKPFWQA